jgi:hypothetical protein
MPNKPEHDVGAYIRAQIKAEKRLLIQSTCNNCGRSAVSAHDDGSLEAWEDAHNCDLKDKSAAHPDPSTQA